MPAAVHPEPPPGAHPAAHPAADSTAVGDKRRESRVLLVDDDIAYRTLCQRHLRRDPERCYRIDTVSSTQEAAERDPTDYDCILVDYFLPDGIGTGLMERWRAAGWSELPPVIVMSASGGERAAVDAVRTHAIDYLAKTDMTRESLRRCVGNATEKGELRREVRARQHELKRAHAALEKRTVEIQRFYHTVSHEMKTPLSATREFISLVNDGIAGPVTAQQGELLGYALESCDQMTRQFHDLIDLTRMETGKLRLEPGTVALGPLLQRCIAMVAGRAQERSIRLHMHLEDGLPPVHVDAGRIGQVVTNLLGNAIKFTPGNGNVHLRARLRPLNRRDAGRVEVSVVDDGCGIEKSSRAHVFDRLYQATREGYETKDSADGLGLGLSISREIVRAHAGEIRVFSRLGVGSTFQFTLPAVEEHGAPVDNEPDQEVPQRTRR